MSEQNIKELPEEMSAFFNARADSYEKHMRSSILTFDEFYSSVVKPIKKTQDKINILDLGCGTGLELKWIFNQAPNARVTGIDVSAEMMKILSENYRDYAGRITLINASYLDYPFGNNAYDYVISVMTMHHFPPDEKLKLYKKIGKSLNADGKYIEGDFTVTPEEEKRFLSEYDKIIDASENKSAGMYHIDIPFSLDTQKDLLKRSGFSGFKLLFRKGEATVYTVRK